MELASGFLKFMRGIVFEASSPGFRSSHGNRNIHQHLCDGKGIWTHSLCKTRVSIRGELRFKTMLVDYAFSLFRLLGGVAARQITPVHIAKIVEWSCGGGAFRGG